jgi:hypothetical protein
MTARSVVRTRPCEFPRATAKRRRLSILLNARGHSRTLAQTTLLRRHGCPASGEREPRETPQPLEVVAFSRIVHSRQDAIKIAEASSQPTAIKLI